MHKREKGNLGEDIACKFLENKGFELVVKNYRKKWGEIDIVARKGMVTHFFEVKSTTSSRGLRETDAHQPEENVHGFKTHQIRKMVQTYFAEKGGGLEVEFHFHVLAVFMDMHTRKARVKWIKDVIL